MKGKLNIRSTYELIKENTGISLGVESDLEKWISYKEFCKVVRSNSKMKNHIEYLTKKLKYEQDKKYFIKKE
jgi:hypothetical protein